MQTLASLASTEAPTPPLSQKACLGLLVRWDCQQIIRAFLVEKRLCLGRARYLEDILVRPTGRGVNPSACVVGQSCVESPFEVAP